jgi:hypothetical protein
MAIIFAVFYSSKVLDEGENGFLNRFQPKSHFDQQRYAINVFCERRFINTLLSRVDL